MRLDTLALLLAAIPAVSFVVVYIFELRYVKITPIARHLIGFTAVLALILLEELFRRGFRDSITATGHHIFITVMATLAGIFLWQRLYLLVRYQVWPRRKGKWGTSQKSPTRQKKKTRHSDERPKDQDT